MFALFRYGLTPVAVYCVVVVAAGLDAYLTNAHRKANWPQTVVTVTQSQDLNQLAAEWRGAPNTFPDPHGTVRYVVDGVPYTWQGRGREIGLTAMRPGDRVRMYYNPKDPREISTLILLGASVGSAIVATAFAFLILYAWFFWLRRLFRPSGPGDPGGADGPRRSRLEERLSGDMEWPRSSPSGPEDSRPAAIEGGPARRSFDQGPRVAFGKR